MKRLSLNGRDNHRHPEVATVVESIYVEKETVLKRFIAVITPNRSLL
jgi:hypothetical protein